MGLVPTAFVHTELASGCTGDAVDGIMGAIVYHNVVACTVVG